MKKFLAIMSMFVLTIVSCIFLASCGTSKRFNVTYNSNGGTVIESTTVEENGILEVPTAPEKEGYKFVGWYVEEEEFNFNTPITSDINLTAKWEIVEYSARIRRATGAYETIKFTIENRAEKLTEIVSTENNAQYTYSWKTALPSELKLNNTQVFEEERTAVEYTAKIIRANGEEEEIKFTVENKATKLASISLTQDSAQYTYSWKEDLPSELELNNTQVFEEIATRVYTIEMTSVLLDSYEKGKTIALPTALVGEENCTLQVLDPDNQEVVIENDKITLNKAGEYTFKFSYVNGQSSINKEVKVRSVEGLPFVSSSDGTKTYSHSGGTNNPTVTLNKNETLTVNKIKDVSGFTFAGSYVIAGFTLPSYVNNYFGKFVIVANDYKDPDNFIKIEIRNGYMAVTATGCQMVTKSGWGESLYSNFNLFFDYTARKIAYVDKNSESMTAEFADFAGFTDNKCYLTVYGEEWVEGVNSVDLTIQYFFDTREDAKCVVSLDDMYVEEDVPQLSSFVLNSVLLDSYEKGKTIALPTATINEDSSTLRVLDPDGQEVVITDNKLTFAKEGVYTLAYTSTTYETLVKEVKVRSVEGLSFVSSSDGTKTYSHPGESGTPTVTLNKNETLTVNKIKDVSGFTFAGSYVIAGFTLPDNVNNYFGKFIIVANDYKNPNNFIKVELGDDYMTVTVTGCESVTKSGWGANSSFNIFFDYTAKKIAFNNKDSESMTAEFANFAGFTDNKCYLTVYGEEWVEGVNSVDLTIQYFFDSRKDVDCVVSLDEMYVEGDVPELTSFELNSVLLDNYEKGKTIVLPTATINEDSSTLKVLDPDGQEVVITDNKLTFEKEGVYTLAYTSTTYETLVKEVKVRSVESLPFVSSSDGTKTYSHPGESGTPTVTLNKNETLTVNKIVDVSGATLEKAYALVGFTLPGNVNNYFGKFVIVINDYKDPDNSIKIEIKNGYMAVTATGCEAVTKSGWDAMSSFNLFFDYTANKIGYNNYTGAESMTAEFANFAGFTDNKCYLTVYGEEWVEGVNSVDLTIQYFFDSRKDVDCVVSLEDMYVKE